MSIGALKTYAVDLQALLESGFDKPIAGRLIPCYQSVIDNYVQGKWEASSIAGGKFVEVGLRALELELSGEYTPFNQELRFDDKLLKKYENLTGEQPYRILIPRVLRAVYDIRNTRGVAHVPSDDISPNAMDATFVLRSVKWVLAEIVRLKSGLSISETESLIEAITKRTIPIIWHEGEIIRILDTRIPIKVKDKVLLLLSHFSDPKTDKELCNMTEYSNFSVFKGQLKALHQKALINYNPKSGLCTISPRGIDRAEDVVKNQEK